MAQWPTDNNFPQRPQVSGFEETWRGNVVRFEPQAGPTKTRLRSTTDIRRYNWTFYLTSLAQRQTFIDFYESDLSYGATVIDLNDPLEESPASTSEWKMLNEPTIRALGHIVFEVSFQVELQP